MDNYGILGIIPPLLAIVLAFLTKDVIISLFLGILSGTLIIAHGNPLTALFNLTDLIAGSLADGWNIRIFLFCALLGGLVGLLTRTGAASSFGRWASSRLKTGKGSQFMTFIFGIIIFIDDYFNSLSVGTVMRPICDKTKVPRAKLAYILDSTAAPVCIIAPISSWVVTVMSTLRISPGFNRLGMTEISFFVQAIPYNLYALITLLMVVTLIVTKRDFGPMKESVLLAESGKLYNSDKYGAAPGVVSEAEESKSLPIDMLFPIIVLIISAVLFFPITTYLDSIDKSDISTPCTELNVVGSTLFSDKIVDSENNLTSISFTSSDIIAVNGTDLSITGDNITVAGTNLTIDDTTNNTVFITGEGLSINGENLTIAGEKRVEHFTDAVHSMSIGEAFNNTDSSKALCYAIIITIFLTYIYYLARRLLSLKEAGGALTNGIMSMVPALIILAMAWSIGTIIKTPRSEGGLGLGLFLSEAVKNGGFPIAILPALLFVLSALIAFATGTSWGTFAIMIPIAMPIVLQLCDNIGLKDSSMLNACMISISAVIGGAVFGDHSSPISDTTILSSTGAGCPHLEHVSTQLPYCIFVAACCIVGFIIGGITLNALLAWAAALIVFILGLIFLPSLTSKKG